MYSEDGWMCSEVGSELLMKSGPAFCVKKLVIERGVQHLWTLKKLLPQKNSTHESGEVKGYTCGKIPRRHKNAAGMKGMF